MAPPEAPELAPGLLHPKTLGDLRDGLEKADVGVEDIVSGVIIFLERQIFHRIIF